MSYFPGLRREIAKIPELSMRNENGSYLSDFEEVEKNIKNLSEKNTQLEEKCNDLLAYLRTNKIEIPNPS